MQCIVVCLPIDFYYDQLLKDALTKSIQSPDKLTNMKHLNFFILPMSYLLITCILGSCAKDSQIAGPSTCDTCGVVNGPVHLKPLDLFIKDSDWELNAGIYTCDLTPYIIQAGDSVSQVNSIYIVEVDNMLQVYPESQSNYMGGPVYATMSTGDNKTCTLFFIKPDKLRYVDDITIHHDNIPPTEVPYRSIELKIFLQQ